MCARGEGFRRKSLYFKVLLIIKYFFNLLIMIFVDREAELEALRDACSSGRSELVLVYGRRRIGKTFMLSFLLRERGGIYLYVNHEERELALRDLVEQLSSQALLPYPPKVTSFKDLYKLLATLKVKPIVVDEFQRLLKAGGLTELQHAWDSVLSREGSTVILSGSAVGVAERIGSSYASPLFGRFTRVVKVEELSYSAVRAFFTLLRRGRSRQSLHGIWGRARLPGPANPPATPS